MTALADLVTIDIDTFRGPDYEEGRHHQECFACGRKMSDKALENAWLVHSAGGGDVLVPIDWDATTEDDISGDVGWHPIGPECAKRIPKTHKMKA